MAGINVLVTGGSGRIGKYVVKELLNHGYKVSVFDTILGNDEGVEYIQGDITNFNETMNAVKGMDIVIHLAAIPTETGEAVKIFNINVGGTFNVLEACAKSNVKKLVYASSVCVYGYINWAKKVVPPYFPVDENVPIFHDNSYGMGKILCENLSKAYSIRYGMDIICLRIATVTFPGAPIWVEVLKDINNPEHEIRAGLSLVQFIWQYVHPSDLAQAFRLATNRLVEAGSGYEYFNIGAKNVLSTVPSMKLVTDYFPEVTCLRNPIEFIKHPQITLYDISKAKKVLGYNPEHDWRSLL